MGRGERAWWLLLAVAITVLDLWSKDQWQYPEAVGAPPLVQKVLIEDWLYIRTIWNPGGVWSMRLPGWILTAGTAAAVPLLLVWVLAPRRSGMVDTIGKLLVLGGAAGNLYDRWRWSAVRDFVDVVLWGWHYPTFNVADMALVVGILVLLLRSFLGGPRKESAPGTR